MTAGQEWRAYWPMVLACVAGMSLAAVATYSFGVLTGSIEREFGWSRTQITLGFTILTLVSAVAAPFAGALVDRFGARTIAFVAIPAMMAGFSALSLTTQAVWTWWLLWALFGCCAALAGPQLWTTSVARNFIAARGLALAVVLSGSSLGALILPIATHALLEAVGWRMTFVGLALIWGGVCLALAGFLPRGSAPASAPPKADAAAPSALATEVPRASLRSALLSKAYIHIFSAAVLFTLAASSMVLKTVPVLRSQGIGAGDAASIAALLGIAAVIGRLSCGWLLDKMDGRIVAASCMALPCLAVLVLLADPGSVPLAMAGIFLFGLALGAELDAVAVFVSRYLDISLYSVLFGTMMSGLALSVAIAPLAASYVFDVSGSYTPMLWAVIPLCLLASTIIATIGPVPEEARGRH